MKTLETKRMILRTMEESDFEDFYELVMDKELSRLYGIPEEKDKKKCFDIFYRFQKRFQSYALEWKENGKMIGFLISCEPVDFPQWQEKPYAEKKGAEFAFAVSPAYQKRGVMTEALKSVIADFFENQQFDYIYAGYYDFNVGSQRLQQKLGFVPCGSHTISKKDGERTIIENVLFKEAFQS